MPLVALLSGNTKLDLTLVNRQSAKFQTTKFTHLEFLPLLHKAL